MIEDEAEETEFINIPANVTKRYARYKRVGEQVTNKGKHLLFDFVGIYAGSGL